MMEKLNTKLFDHTILKADATKEAEINNLKKTKKYKNKSNIKTRIQTFSKINAQSN